jgi:hypothetical protein
LRIAGFIWYSSVVNKLARKHNVQRYEVIEAFANNPNYDYVEDGDYPGENIYSASGKTDAGRYLIVFFIYKKDRRALILSARDMISAERKRYAQT